MDWATLPEELLTTIFSFLTCADLTRVICVNATWHALSDYNNIWKQAILNDSFPHHYSTSQKNVPWRQIAKRHFETKRNIIKKRCVQHTLGTWCPGSNKNIGISITRSNTVNAKHCILAWETSEKQDFYLVNINHLATELWDLETRTIVSVVQTTIKNTNILNPKPKRIELFNDFVIEVGRSNVFYSKFDPVDISPKTEISIQKTDPDDEGSTIWVTCNEDPNSSLIAIHWRMSPNDEDRELCTVIYDLRTGEKIFEKKYESDEVLLVEQFYGDKILMRNYNIYGHLLVVDVFQNTEALIEVESECATMAGNNVWVLTNGGSLIRYDIQSREQIEYKMSEQIRCDTYMRVYDGLLWFFVSSTTITIADVSSGSKCQILTHMTRSTLPDWGKPTVTQLANGTFACLSTSYAHILSFKDEDIELPIEVLQFEPNGKSEILRIAQGDLNKMIAEYSSTSVSSQIVFEDEKQRYCVIFTYKADLEDKGVNQFVETAKKWLEKPEYHKTAIFQLVHFNSECKPLEVLNPTALGRAWVIYETKVNGAWQRTAPLDHWKFFKSKLELK